MVHTVGIVGVNGNVGAPTAKLLVKAAEEGKIRVVIFHREGSTTKGLSPGKNIEFRVLDFSDAPEKIEAAIKGVNFFISAVGFEALPSEPNVVDALAKSPDLVSYMPSTYSTTWDAQDYKDASLGPVLKFIHGGWDRAKDKGVGVTAVYVGIYENYMFAYGYIGAGVQGNSVWANEKQLKNTIPVTVLDHLAAAICRIAIADPQTVRNKEFSVVTFQPTGQELVELYTKLNGKQAKVKPWTAADRDALNADVVNFGAAKVGYFDHWEKGDFSYESGGKVIDRKYDGAGIEEIARRFL